MGGGGVGGGDLAREVAVSPVCPPAVSMDIGDDGGAQVIVAAARRPASEAPVESLLLHDGEGDPVIFPRALMSSKALDDGAADELP